MKYYPLFFVFLIVFAFSAKPVHAGDITIRITSAGFFPKEATVDFGTTVTFINDDRVSHWPASDPHPIHDDYAEFDSKRAVLPGKLWSFRFTKSGTFRFHDHVNSSVRGTIIVRKGRETVIDSFRQAAVTVAGVIERAWVKLAGYSSRYGLRLRKANETIDDYILIQMKKCFPFGGRHPCYKDVTDLFLKQFGVVDILEAMKRNETIPEIYGRCHEVGHYMGRYLYRKTKNIRESFAQCDVMTCGVGCQHGIGEEFFRDKHLSIDNSDDELGKEISTACGTEKDYERPILYHECLHGLGHGLMEVSVMDVPRSLKLCDYLPGVWNQEGCYAGVFMENAGSLTVPDHPSKYLKRDDPLYPCNILDKKYLKLCYEYQTSYFGSLTNWQWSDTAALCKKVPAKYQDSCFSQIAAHEAMSSRGPAKVSASCEYITNIETKNQCVNQSVSTFGGRYIEEPSLMLEFCALVDPRTKQTCYELLGGQILFWGNGEKGRDKVCDTVNNQQYAYWCKHPTLFKPK